MAEPTIHYDAESDTVYIAFQEGKSATGIGLNDDILLRIDKQAGEAVGITIFNFAALSQPTDVGPRSFPLSGLESLPDDLRELVIDILRREPVSSYLHLSAYSPSMERAIPITSVDTELITSRAA
jgi:uncharacterized protein YuzE